MQVPVPANETERLAALRRYEILDTPPEVAYDEITELAAQICGCPVAVVGLIDETRDWLKAKYGLPPDFTEAPREVTICSTTICNNDLVYIPDLTKDPRFKDAPPVAGEPGLRMYCGMPLITPEGYALGTLCVIDFEPHELSFEQQQAVRRLCHQTVAQLELRRQVLEHETILRELRSARDMAEAEKEKSERLLLNILPPSIADELKAHARVQPRFYDSVSVVFSDFKGFTQLIERLEPASVVQQLDQHFSRFDEIVTGFRLEKLKTIGDAFMAAGGLPEANRTHPVDACLAALHLQDYLARTNRQREKLHLPLWEARIGINTGPAIAGVVGRHKFTYDVWGNTVNVAERMEAAGVPGRVNISEATWNHVRTWFETEPRGSVTVKGKGEMNMYFLDRIKPEFSADATGLVPNEHFWTHHAGSLGPVH
ncbi:adenylate/guanylate cyclase domain-containing protein [Chelatococcus sp. SYSU_G07232]|uniref:Adenylate/guanylate cyclase domain-containing protein n=1 Tax=Chelatococcus albus TaxID=3047466 RepID=A0ABT7AGS3_9HYPH|nr:adenylate/guanylate cyclase domain-containing protein [Chelatococcus sp. SYSU_G07232]MDJ1158571.1 adenylate/guanylate cyclase domain-containing protein [Chelatococcus sp. SYSU_G07232]